MAKDTKSIAATAAPTNEAQTEATPEQKAAQKFTGTDLATIEVDETYEVSLTAPIKMGNVSIPPSSSVRMLGRDVLANVDNIGHGRRANEAL